MSTGKTTVEFTQDMAETLCRHFGTYARDGRVTLELHAGGVWLLNPTTNSRQFLGATRRLEWPRPDDIH